MAAVRSSAALATAIVALMVLSTLAGVASATPHAGSPAASAAASTPATSAASHLPAVPGLSPTGRGLSVGTPSPALPRTSGDLPAPPSAPAVVSGAASPAAGATPSDRTDATLAALRSADVPLRYAFLPNLNAQPHPSLSPYGTVVPSYTTGSPAPVGVAEYGVTNVSGTLVPENLSTTGLIGFFSSCNEFDIGSTYCTDPQVLAMDSGTPDAYGIQLNAVLENVTLFNRSGYDFWTQNVLEYSTYSHQLYIVTNIWNFSSLGAGMTPNAIASHGPNGTIVPGELYYSVTGPINISDDFEAALEMYSGVIDGSDAVEFEYFVANNTEEFGGVNDYAVFNSTGGTGPSVSAPAEWVASGSTYTPLGIPADWEFVMGGPGGGSNLDVFSLFTEMDLYYLNASDDLLPVPSAYNVGSETGETSIGASTTWEGDWSPVAVAGPGEMVDPGPTIVEGMWNVTNSTQGLALLANELAPSNGFTFMGLTTDPYDYAAYTWAPMFWLYIVSPGVYGIWSLASNYDPSFSVEGLANGSAELFSTVLTYDEYAGVYTPLWALNETGLENITWNGNMLFNDVLGPLGSLPFGPSFPFFAEMNDYTYPVFAGILLWYTYEAVISNPPTFTVEYPSWYAPYLDYYGLPSSNQLPILVYDSDEIALVGATAISGWWFTLAFFGPTAPQYDVVFWNTSYSLIFDNTFLTSSNALYLYGGTDNEIFNNTFVQAFPAAADPYAISGAYYGTYALLEADYGDYAFGGELCECNDLIYNNLFDTYFTAYSPLLDPYTGGAPLLPFSEDWNLPYTPGIENIIGGDYLAGNYWWNYGASENPYGVLPYDNLQFYYEYLWGLFPVGIFWGGDYYPLTPTPVYTVTFVEVGLPAGAEWTPEVLASDGFYVTNYTTLDYANESWVGGVYNLSAFTFANDTYVGPGELNVTGNETVVVEFAPDYTVSFHETGLPAGALWGVIVYSYSTFEIDYSVTPYANFSLPNGSYYYDTGAVFVYYLATDPFAAFSVNGSSRTIDLEFVPAYDVTIAETGLPAGASWTFIWQIVGPDGSNGSLTTNASSYDLGYGLGGWTIDWWATAPGYVATPASGTLLLESNTTIEVAFAASATIVFDETGLGAGAAWTVAFTQGASTTTQTTTGTTMAFGAEAGTYTYTVSAADYVPTHGSGSGTLPADTPVDVAFSPAPASVTFTETGLPAGTEWWVNFTQAATTTSYSSETDTISISAVDAGYTYTAAAAGFSAAPASGAGVLPADPAVAIAFSPTPATVTFTETGLPAGASWTVEFTQGATTTDVSGATASIAIAAVDGAYSYTVKAANYSAGDEASGSGTLPADATVSVAFAVVDGTLAGTITPTDASLTVGTGAVTLGAGGAYSTNLAPGTYAVKVTAAGYYPYYTNVTVVSGKTTSLTVHLTAIPASPKPFLGVASGTDWVLIAALAVLVVVLLGTTFLFMRRARRPPQMTQYSGGSPPPAGAGGQPAWSESDSGTPPTGKS